MGGGGGAIGFCLQCFEITVSDWCADSTAGSWYETCVLHHNCQLNGNMGEARIISQPVGEVSPPNQHGELRHT